MSKTKNTEEFHRMMDELNSATMFNYAEQEQEKEQLLKDLAAHNFITQAVDEYIEAQKVFLDAMEKFSLSLDAYKDHKSGLNEDEEKLIDNTDMLKNMFKGFNPADI
jgi:hypothetical protein